MLLDWAKLAERTSKGNTMNLELLENQAWALLVKISKLIDSERKGNLAKPTPPTSRKKHSLHIVQK
jgi:hypothetical protein